MGITEYNLVMTDCNVANQKALKYLIDEINQCRYRLEDLLDLTNQTKYNETKGKDFIEDAINNLCESTDRLEEYFYKE